MPVIEILSQDEKSTRLKVLATAFHEKNPYDLTGEYFSQETYFGDDKLKQKFAVYDHALNELQNELADYAPPDPILGVATFLEKNDTGRWFEVELDRANAYHDFVMELHKRGRLGVSSRTLPGSKMKSVTADGHITRWPEVEISLTPTPAEPRTAYSAADFEAIKSVMHSHLLPRLEKKSFDAEKKDDAGTAVADTPVDEKVQALLDSVGDEAPVLQPDPLVDEVAQLRAKNEELEAQLKQQADLLAEMQKSLTALVGRVESTEKAVVKNTEFVTGKMTDIISKASTLSNQQRAALDLPPMTPKFMPPPAAPTVNPVPRLNLKSAFGDNAPGSN